MTAPRIPRHRAPLIPAWDRPHWYETTAHRIVALVLLGSVGGFLVHGLATWWGAA